LRYFRATVARSQREYREALPPNYVMLPAALG